MRRYFQVLILVTALAGSFGSAGAAPNSQANDRAPVHPAPEKGIEDQYIVVLKEGANPRSVAAVAGVNPKYVYTEALNGFAATLNRGQLTALQHNPNVEYIEQDAEVQLDPTTQNPVPSWGLDRIDQRDLPLANGYTYTNTGANVTAYIIDTGILTSHDEFGGRASFGYDAFGGNGSDCHGHGTHVAGTVGGTKHGVAKEVTLKAVRVLNCSGSGSWSGVIAGINWVISHHGSNPAVANMSLGGGRSSSVDTAVNNMINDKVATAVAAGNNGRDAKYFSPARVSAAMTIGATDNTDKKASWSNYGSLLDWFAPGVSITSAWIGNNSATVTISGTSMAAPHTAGVAALYLQSNPSASPSTVRTALYNNTTKDKVSSARSSNDHLLFTPY